MCLLYSRFQDYTRTVILRVFSRNEVYHWISASNSSTGELSMSNLIAARVQMGNYPVRSNGLTGGGIYLGCHRGRRQRWVIYTLS